MTRIVKAKTGKNDKKHWALTKENWSGAKENWSGAKENWSRANDIKLFTAVIY